MVGWTLTILGGDLLPIATGSERAIPRSRLTAVPFRQRDDRLLGHFHLNLGTGKDLYALLRYPFPKECLDEALGFGGAVQNRDIPALRIIEILCNDYYFRVQ